MTFPWQYQPVTVPAQLTPGAGWVQLATSTAAGGTDAIPVLLTPGEYVIPASTASFPVTWSPVTTMTATAPVTWALDYIAEAYGPRGVTAKGITFRARPMTMAELLGGHDG